MRLRDASIFTLAAGGAGLALASAFAADAPTPAAVASPKKEVVTFEKTIQPILEKNCYQCHGNGQHKADIALDEFKSAADVDKDKGTWKLVYDMVLKRQMPPEDARVQPTQEERDAITDWVQTELYKYDPANPDPGQVVLRRLNRAEYRNTIRDLTGVEYNVTTDFPPDDAGYGFDNIGSVLSLPPMLMEKYLAAADKILDKAIPTEPLKRTQTRVPVRFAQIGFNAVGVREDGWAELKSYEQDDVTLELNIPAPGDYIVRFLAYGVPTGGYFATGVGYRPATLPTNPETPQMSIRVDDTQYSQFLVDAPDPDHAAVYEARVGVTAGVQRFRAVVDRIRGGELEDIIVNGKPGRQQNGLAFVKWIEVDGPLDGATRRYPADKLDSSGNNTVSNAGERTFTELGDVSVKINVPKEGDYLLRAYAYAAQSGDELARMDFRIDGKSLKTFDVIAPARHLLAAGARVFSGHPSALNLLRANPRMYETVAHLTPGEKMFSAAFTNPFSDPKNSNANLRQRALTVESLEIVNLSEPFIQPEMTGVMKQYFAKTPTPENKTALAREILTQFATRAWRRPPPADDMTRLMKLFTLADSQGESFAGSIKLAMKGVLVSPYFIFRDENPAPTATFAAMPAASAQSLVNTGPRTYTEGVKLLLRAPTVMRGSPTANVAAVAATKPAIPAPPPASLGVPVDEYSLASRLSYFLWSSTPDDELLGLAQKNQLRKNLDAQVRRMLASPKARALVDNFAGQWLQFRGLENFSPDPDMFPAFSREIRTAMQQETEHFFDYIMRQDRSVMDFLTADYTFVNADLAQYYGIEGVTGEEFEKVSLKGTPRLGVLTQGSVLVLTSNPTRTSPVKRGKWVLENLLGTPPPPPPPNVPALEATELTGTLRQQMEQHRANPTCASCHARMDPIGFGFENFDAVGLWRDNDVHGAVDASGQLVSGENFKGAAELVQILAEKKRSEFLHCVAEKMLTYALGRGLEYYDRAATDQIVANLEQNGDKFSALVFGVVHSIPFQQMRRETPAEQPGSTVSQAGHTPAAPESLAKAN